MKRETPEIFFRWIIEEKLKEFQEESIDEILEKKSRGITEIPGRII